MKKSHWALVALLSVPFANTNAAVVDRSNPDYTDQSDTPSQGGVFLDSDEGCGIGYGAPGQRIDSSINADEFPGSRDDQHGYENSIYQCNQYFAQFSQLTIK